MQFNFSPSVNIQRDATKELTYIPTPNAQTIFNQLVNDYKKGTHAFNIIGSYGTGKSAFIVALERMLRGEATYFGQLNGQFKGIQQFEFINIVGTFDSLLNVLGEELNAKQPYTSKSVMKALKSRYQTTTTNGACLFLVIDEFGKHLEYAAQNKPEVELYFIQQLAEYVNDETKNIVLLTTLHQNFATYANTLTEQQQNEWIKVKGRLKDLTFNEPVEQLLLLAADYMQTTDLSHPNPDVDELTALIEKANLLRLNSEVTTQIVHKLAPFDLLAAAILTLALQKYGQNQRSLFTFLNSADLYSLQNYNALEHPFYNLSCIYDYLIYNYYSYLSAKNNPHYIQWRAIQKAIERIEGSLKKEQMVAAIKLVKTIGLLNTFASEGATIDTDFLEKYAQLSLGITHISEVIETLEKRKIILFKKYKNQYVLFEGTDFDIEVELLKAANQISKTSNILTPLRQHFNFPYIPAKAIHYQKGTPRFFEFQLSETPINQVPSHETDGIINLIFSENLDIEVVKEHAKEIDEAIIFACFHNVQQIKYILFEIDKLAFLLKKEEIRDDVIAYQELQNLKAHEVEKLNNLVLNHLFDGGKTVTWIYKGEVLVLNSQTQFNKQLSEICREVYWATPVFKNELVNRHQISGSIATARKYFFKKLFKNAQKEDLGFDKRLFPAEKTIYLTLLKQTGIHQRKNTIHFTLGRPTEASFEQLWQISEQFLESAKINRRSLQEFESVLASKPLKLKKGVIDFWLLIFLYIKQDDFALFRDDIYVPTLTLDEVDVMYRNLGQYKVKTFNVSGVRLDLFNKYRELLSQTNTEQPSQQNFIETIKPFLTFYHQLPQYTQQTGRLEKHTLQFREAIKTATDPEATFFDAFPAALGYQSIEFLKDDPKALQAYVDNIQDAIRQLRTAYDELLDRVESNMLRDLGYKGKSFNTYRKKFNYRFKAIKKHLLLTNQKTFFARLNSPLDDRAAWLNSLVTAVMRKPLSQLRDEEEAILYEKLSATFRELDNLCDIHGMDVDFEKEYVVKIDVTTLEEGTKGYQVRLGKGKMKEVMDLQMEIERMLTDNNIVNKIALIKLLNNLLK